MWQHPVFVFIIMYLKTKQYQVYHVSLEIKRYKHQDCLIFSFSHIANMRKDENIEFTFVNPEIKHKNKQHVFTFMDLENQLKLHVSQICSDYQISENVHFHAVKVCIRKYIS